MHVCVCMCIYGPYRWCQGTVQVLLGSQVRAAVHLPNYHLQTKGLYMYVCNVCHMHVCMYVCMYVKCMYEIHTPIPLLWSELTRYFAENSSSPQRISLKLQNKVYVCMYVFFNTKRNQFISKVSTFIYNNHIHGIHTYIHAYIHVYIHTYTHIIDWTFSSCSSESKQHMDRDSAAAVASYSRDAFDKAVPERYTAVDNADLAYIHTYIHTCANIHRLHTILYIHTYINLKS